MSVIKTRILRNGGWATGAQVFYADLFPGAEIRFGGIGLARIVDHYGENDKRAEYVRVSDGLSTFFLKMFALPQGGYAFLLCNAPVSHYDGGEIVLYARQ